MRILPALLPPLTVCLCVLLNHLVCSSHWIDEKIHSIHNDIFTLQLAEHTLWLAKLVIPALLVTSLLLYNLARKEFAGYKRRSWDYIYCIVTIIATCSIALRFWQCPFALDDSYIDYRYVRHWLEGQFDYNIGEPVMGFTSHLHLMILWALCTFLQTQAIDMLSYYLNCASEAACTILLFFLILKVTGRILPATIGSLYYAVNMFACAEVISGKETSLVSLTILIALGALKTNRPGLLPWCANALFLFRPEGICACVVMLATAFRANYKLAIRSAILPCALTLAWYVFLYLHFGTIFPHGMLAKYKVLAAVNPDTACQQIVIVIGSMLTNSCLSFLLPGTEWWPFLILPPLLFIYSFMRFKDPAWSLYRNIALVQLIFLLGSRPRLFNWYFCWFAVMGPIFAAQLSADIIYLKGKGVIKRTAIAAMQLALCAFLFVYFRTGFIYIPYDWVSYIERGKVYREAALYMMERTRGLEPIAASDVGLIGFNYTGPILDLMGLISEQPLKYYPIPNNVSSSYFIPPTAIAALKPKYIVAPICHCQAFLLKDPDFQKHYVEIKRWENPNIVERFVCVWMRKDESAAGEAK